MRWIPFSVASRFFPVRTMKPRFSNTSIMAARVAGVPSPVSFIASDNSFSSRLWPAVCIAVRRVPSVNRFGGRVFFFLASISMTSWNCPLPSITGRTWSGVSSAPLLYRRISPSSFRHEIESLPAHLLHEGPRGPIAVHNLSFRDRRYHGRHCLEEIVMPHHEKALADEVVNLAFVLREVGLLSRDRCRDDGVVVAHLGVVHIPLSQGARSRTQSQLRLIAHRNGGDNPRGCCGNIGRKMPAIGPRIADKFVSLIESLGEIKGLMCAEAEQAIGMALKFRKVV